MIATERSVEIPWAIDKATAPVLDVGCAESTYIKELAGPVDGIDTRPVSAETLGLRHFYELDIRTAPEYIHARYATVAAISTIEHIGLEHAPYATQADDTDHGDRRALEACHELCSAGGQVLMSVPYGDDENRGWYRRYSQETLGDLCEGFDWSWESHMDPSWAVGGVALVTIRRH